MSVTPQDVVALYLRGQNLEQVRRFDEAVSLYEEAVSAAFDAVGPYDRLIAIYRVREQYEDIIRVATAALSSVRTYDDKRVWYEAIRTGAEEALSAQPDRRGAEF